VSGTVLKPGTKGMAFHIMKALGLKPILPSTNYLRIPSYIDMGSARPDIVNVRGDDLSSPSAGPHIVFQLPKQSAAFRESAKELQMQSLLLVHESGAGSVVILVDNLLNHVSHNISRTRQPRAGASGLVRVSLVQRRPITQNGVAGLASPTTSTGIALMTSFGIQC